VVVPAVYPWKSNAHLIEDVAKLGYLEGHVLDATYGLGTFWKRWQPEKLTTNDLYCEAEHRYDFRSFPVEWKRAFDVTVFDPPYKLNGRPDPKVDGRYGVDRAMPWQDRYWLIIDGLLECRQVTKRDGFVLLKCQDQVCSGAVRWQTIDFTNAAKTFGMTLVDRFDMTGKARKQPMTGRKQRHAHGRPSTLLVFQRD
jgi:hypothetical protein